MASSISDVPVKLRCVRPSAPSSHVAPDSDHLCQTCVLRRSTPRHHRQGNRSRVANFVGTTSTRWFSFNE
ncbi:hypothetical protein Trydic_g18113 [Trypoxylus dichotomus]